MSKLLMKILSGLTALVSATLIILFICAFIKNGSEDTPEPQVCEPIGYAIVNGERYDISRYATNNGHPYVWTTDGMEIIGAGITVFIPND